MSESVVDVVWPLGKVAQTKTAIERKRGGLAGARLAFAWDYGFKGDKMWDVVRQEFSRLYPNISFIGPDEFGNIHDKFGSSDVANVGLRQRMRELEITAAIVGVGA